MWASLCFFTPPTRAARLRSVLTGRSVGHFGECGAGRTTCPVLGFDSAGKVGVTRVFLHVHSRLWPSQFLGPFSFFCNLIIVSHQSAERGEAFYQSFKKCLRVYCLVFSDNVQRPANYQNGLWG